MIKEVLERMRFFENMERKTISLEIAKIPNNPRTVRRARFSIDGVEYVPYSESHIVLYPVDGGISFSFSGCAMAYFTVDGFANIAHICLTGAGNEYDCRDIWNEKVNSGEYQNVKLFYPATDSLMGLLCSEYEKRKKQVPPDKLFNICGYISPDDQHCYSALIDLERKCVIAEEEHQPYNGSAACLIPVIKVKNHSVQI